MELTLGGTVLKAVVFDRDYRSDKEVASTKAELLRFATLAHIHQRKELENYLMGPGPLNRALLGQIAEHNRRTDENIRFEEDMQSILVNLSEPMKHMVSAQFLAKRSAYERAKTPNLDLATITQPLLEEFEEVWHTWEQRCVVLPGKVFLSLLNRHIQENYKVTLTPKSIIDAMSVEEVPSEIVTLIEGLDAFRRQLVQQ